MRKNKIYRERSREGILREAGWTLIGARFVFLGEEKNLLL